jgi:hypothetical protein
LYIFSANDGDRVDLEADAIDRLSGSMLRLDLLVSLGATSALNTWGEGVYLMSLVLKTGIIVIHQLPQTPARLANSARQNMV